MNRPTRILAALLLPVLVLLVGGADTPPEPDSRARLVVRVEGLKSSKGSVALALFDDREAFEARSPAVRAEFVPLSKKRGKWVVENLRPGTYALVAYHDRNGNRELDRRKMFGIPSEPYGFSNDARGSFGPPPFEDARFEVGQGSSTITVRLR